MNELITEMTSLVTPQQLLAFARAFALLVVGYLIAKLASRGLVGILRQRLDTGQTILLKRVIFYPLLGLFLTAALHELGFDLGVLLGAAGVVSVAVGFAAQTSIANLISGLFLIGEKSFEPGDVISTGGITGEVLSIDLMSVKLRTFDNQFVRLPNDSLIKSEVRSLTRFPLRRVDLHIGVAYKEDLGHVRDVLFATAGRNPLSLEDPAPLYLVRGFGDSSIDLQFSVWGQRERFTELKNTIQEDIKEAFDDAGIDIPFPQRTLRAAPAAEPLSIRLVAAEAVEPTG